MATLGRRNNAALMASTDQDLSDLAGVVLSKLRERGADDDAHPLRVVVTATCDGRKHDEACTQLKRVWMDGVGAHWRLSVPKLHHRQPDPKVLPLLQDPRTVIRFAVGRLRFVSGHFGSLRVQMIVHAGPVDSVIFDALQIFKTPWTGDSFKLDFKHELEMVRILQELARVRIVPVDPMENKVS